MQSFRYFDLPDILVLILVFMVICAWVARDYLKVSRGKRKQGIAGKGWFWAGGVFLVLLAVGLLFSVERSIQSTSLKVLEPIAIMTSEPYVLLAFTTFFAGLGLLSMGFWRQRR